MKFLDDVRTIETRTLDFDRQIEIMRLRILLLLLFLISPSIVNSQIRLELQPLTKPDILMCEPGGIIVSWQNVSEQPVYIGPAIKPTENSAVTILVNGQLRMPTPNQMMIDYAVGAKSTLEPGETLSSGINYLGLNLEHGTYKVQAIANFENFPQGYFQGKAESNIIKFTIKFPTDHEDLHAWNSANNLAQQQQSIDGNASTNDDFLLAVCAELSQPDFLELFPTSTFAAYEYLRRFPLYNSKLSPQQFINETTAKDSKLLPGGFVEHSKAGGIQHRHWQTSEERVREMLVKGEKLLPKHQKDMFLGPKISMNVAMAKMIAGQKLESKLQFEMMLRDYPHSELAQKAHAFIGLMSE